MSLLRDIHRHATRPPYGWPQFVFFAAGVFGLAFVVTARLGGWPS